MWTSFNWHRTLAAYILHFWYVFIPKSIVNLAILICALLKVQQASKGTLLAVTWNGLKSLKYFEMVFKSLMKLCRHSHICQQQSNRIVISDHCTLDTKGWSLILHLPGPACCALIRNVITTQIKDVCDVALLGRWSLHKWNLHFSLSTSAVDLSWAGLWMRTFMFGFVLITFKYTVSIVCAWLWCSCCLYSTSSLDVASVL